MNDSIILKNIFSRCNELICSDIFKSAYRIGSSFTRSRKLSFSNAIYFILGASKKALSSNLADFIDLNPSLSFPALSRQAFSKARTGIHFEALKELFRSTVSSFYSLSTNLNKWHDFLVLAVDGTSLQLPDTSENRTTFGFIKNQHSPGRAICSASVIYDVLNDILIDGAINRYGFSERKLALDHLDALDCISHLPDSIITFDRGYPSQLLFHEMNRRNIKFVIRAASSYRLTNHMNAPDTVFLNVSNDQTATFRCINLTLSSGAKEQLITNILDTSFSISDFKELYFLRWGIEVKYKELKGRLQIEEFTGNRPITIKQDFYSALFFSNLVSIAKREVDSSIRDELHKKNSNKSYQANRSFLISRVKYFLIKLLIDDINCLSLIDRLVNESKKMRSQIIPDRTCERKTHLFLKKHYKNMKTCI